MENLDGFCTLKEAQEIHGVNPVDVEREAINRAWEIRHGPYRIRYYDIDDILDLKEGRCAPKTRRCLGCGKQAMEGRYYCSICARKRRDGEALRPDAPVAMPGPRCGGVQSLARRRD
jgi:hypothetical protein